MVITGTFIIIILLISVFIFFGVYQKKRLKFWMEKKQMQSDFSETLLTSQIQIQEQTRQHISRELHDNLGQIASLIKINLNTVTLQHPEKAAQKIEDTRELTRQLINDIKMLSVSLNSDRITKTGLLGAIATEIERINKTEAFHARFLTEGSTPELTNDTSIILFRMIQEVLNNMIKHSQASEITVTANTSNNLFILAVSDNGTGFNVEEKLLGGGQGLINLKHRAALLQAKFELSSAPGSGTQVTIEVPV